MSTDDKLTVPLPRALREFVERVAEQQDRSPDISRTGIRITVDRKHGPRH